MNRRGFHLVLGALLLAWFFFTRVHGLAGKSIWVDEAITWHYAQLGGWDLVKEVQRFDSHPPLFYLLSWCCSFLFPDEAGLRCPSLLAGLLLPWVVWKLARETEGQNCARWSLLLCATSPYLTYFSQEARNYCLAALWAALAAWILVQLRKSESTIKWCVYGLLLLCCMYTYLYLALFLSVLSLWWIWNRFQERKGPGWGWCLCHGGAAFLFLPWLPTVLQRAGLQNEVAGQMNIGLTGWDLAKTINHFSLGYHDYLSEAFLSLPGQQTAVLLAVLLGGLAVWGISRSKERSLWLFLLLGVGGLFCLLPVRLHYFDAKHLFFLLPFFLIAQAKGVERMKRFALKGTCLGCLLLFNLASTLWYHSASFQKAGWKDLALLAAREGRADDLVVFDPFYIGYALDFYVDKETVLCNRIGPRTETPCREIISTMVKGQRVWLFTSRSPVTGIHPEIRTCIEERRTPVADVGIPSETFPFVGFSEALRMTLFSMRPSKDDQEEVLPAS